MKPGLLVLAVFLTLAFSSCHKDWKPGTPIAKEKIKVGVVHLTDPFSETSGYSYAHQIGIEEMKRKLGLEDSQVIYKINIDDMDSLAAENAHRELIAQGANVIFSPAWGYMDTCEKLAREFPSVVFAHGTGYKNNDTNFTYYYGRADQARYLSGIAAGTQTKTGKIGYVAAWGMDNTQVTQGLNGFALGVEKVNPHARIYVKVIYSWFDPMGEAVAARALIAEGCDVIAQHCDSPTPQIEAQRAGVLGVGYNTDMSVNAPAAVLTSVIWDWGVYYTALVESVINGTFTTKPYLGSIKDGLSDITPLTKNVDWSADTLRLLAEERQRIESGGFDVYNGILETNDGRRFGKEGENFSEDEIHSGIDWYYRTVIEL